MIKPTIGRVVWFFQNGVGRPDEKRQPNAMLVAFVHSDDCLNLGGFNSNGQPISACSVRLLQEGAQYPETEAFCCWMPYQIGQAAKEKSVDNLNEVRRMASAGAPLVDITKPAAQTVADKAAKEAAVAKEALQQHAKPTPLPLPGAVKKP